MPAAQTYMAGTSWILKRSMIDGENPSRLIGQTEEMDKIAEGLIRAFERYGTETASLAKPQCRVRIDPNRLMIDLIAEKVDPIQGLAWRAQEFDGGRFRSAIKQVVSIAIRNWIAQEYRSEIWGNYKGEVRAA